jgi:hypothetical protein
LTKKMAGKELGCVGGNPMHKEGGLACWRQTMKLWNWKSEMDELQRVAGMTRSCEELREQGHVVNSFHQLSLCSRRIWEFFFICKFVFSMTITRLWPYSFFLC